MRRLLTRSIRPPDEVVPNPNDPADVPPATVGPPEARPGDPHGLTLDFDGPGGTPPPAIMRPVAWSGWPAEWWTPGWGSTPRLTDTAWTCLDLNASLLSTMPPYLVDPAPSGIDAGWLVNPDPDIYSSWQEFAKQLFWDYMLGEVFVLATARYSSGWPARFHVVPPWAIEVDMDAGFRRYRIGSVDVSADVCHLRYQSSVDDAHGHGPLEAGNARLVAADLLHRYAFGLVNAGGIPSSILTHPARLDEEQANDLKAQWIQARTSGLGEPAVLSGGVTWEATQLNPQELALTELSDRNESRIAIMLGVPPFLVGLPSGADPMTYSNVTAIFDYHWRAGLRPKAEAVTSGLSEWLLPRGTYLEINRDAYVQPGPKERAEIEQIYVAMGAMSVDEVRQVENIGETTTAGGPIVG